MITAVEQSHLNIDDGIAGEHPIIECFANALLNRRDIFAGNRSTLDAVDKFETAARHLGFQLDPNIAVLATTAGLAHKTALLLDRFSHGLAIGNLGLTDTGADTEFPEQTIDDNF